MADPYGGSVYGGQPWGSYYLPGFDYGSPLGNMSSSPIADYLQRQNWQIAFDAATGGAGLSPFGSFAQFVRSQEPLMQRAYNAALLANPNLVPQDFLKQYIGQPGQGAGASLMNTFQSLPYQLRAEDPARWGQGATQWVRRM